MDEKQLAKAERLSALLDDGKATAEEVAEAIQVVLSIVAQTSEVLERRLEQMGSGMSAEHLNLTEMIRKMEEKLQGGKSDMKECMAMISKLSKEIKRIEGSITPEDDLTDLADRIKDVERKIPKIPDELPAERIRSKLESLDGTDRLKIDAIDDLRNELNEIRRLAEKKGATWIGGGGSSGGGKVVRSYDLYSQLNGVLKTFPLPAFYRVISVHSSSAPFSFRPTVDFTTDASAMTITFTSEIDATTTLAEGQTVTIIYSEA